MASNLSEFQKEKHTALFYRFYDSNRSGAVTHADFAELRKSLEKMRGWEQGDERATNAAKALHAAWAAIKSAVDANADSKVTLSEWLEYWGGFASAKAKMEAGQGWPEDAGWAKDYADFWFDLMDTSGDELIDEEEFKAACGHFGAAEADAKAAFDKFSQGQPVTRELYSTLWLEYMTGDEAGSPATAVFGDPHLGQPSPIPAFE